MNLRDCYVEEDLFPMIFTEYEERDWQSLFRLRLMSYNILITLKKRG